MPHVTEKTTNLVFFLLATDLLQIFSHFKVHEKRKKAARPVEAGAQICKCGEIAKRIAVHIHNILGAR
jgi:hypothetical protein